MSNPSFRTKGEWLEHLSPSLRQLRVPPDASLHVVLALSVATQVDGVGVHVDVHEVVHDFTLDVVLHLVDQETTADVDDLDEGAAPARQREKEEDRRRRHFIPCFRCSRKIPGRLVCVIDNDEAPSFQYTYSENKSN